MKRAKLLYLAIVVAFSLCQSGLLIASAPVKQPTLERARAHMLHLSTKGPRTPFPGSQYFNKLAQEITKSEIKENEKRIAQLEAQKKKQQDSLQLTIAAQQLIQSAGLPKSNKRKAMYLYYCGTCQKGFNDNWVRNRHYIICLKTPKKTKNK
jgi:hypothetical protein